MSKSQYFNDSNQSSKQALALTRRKQEELNTKSSELNEREVNLLREEIDRLRLAMSEQKVQYTEQITELQRVITQKNEIIDSLQNIPKQIELFSSMQHSQADAIKDYFQAIEEMQSQPLTDDLVSEYDPDDPIFDGNEHLKIESQPKPQAQMAPIVDEFQFSPEDTAKTKHLAFAMIASPEMQNEFDELSLYFERATLLDTTSDISDGQILNVVSRHDIAIVIAPDVKSASLIPLLKRNTGTHIIVMTQFSKRFASLMIKQSI